MTILCTPGVKESNRRAFSQTDYSEKAMLIPVNFIIKYLRKIEKYFFQHNFWNGLNNTR